MKQAPVWVFGLALAMAATGPASAKDFLWSPKNFDGAWVEVRDNAKNGCWTNIGESQTYAEDQLKIAGFKMIEKPEVEEDGNNPLLDGFRVKLIIDVRGSRWKDGLCVGHIMTHFLGSVVPRDDQDSIIVNPIGPTEAWTIWDEKNFNTYVLDHIKAYVGFWIRTGEVEEEK
jgi:hypothetical protein